MIRTLLVSLIAFTIGCSFLLFFSHRTDLQYNRPLGSPEGCDPSLWQHVYTGDLRRFQKPQDRLHVIKDCVTITGIIETAKSEADGDFHIRLKLDPLYASMLNSKNVSGQRGDLVLEPVCENPITQKDTIAEGSCNGFHQDIFQKSMLGHHVKVIGAFVLDQEHGWNELHPVTSIAEL